VSGNIITTASTGTANIGNVTNTFNTVHAKATTAQYADLAECYEADAEYAPGTVLSFGGTKEVTITDKRGISFVWDRGNSCATIRFSEKEECDRSENRLLGIVSFCPKNCSKT
jgi:hypothetical protein